ncbi:MAG: hypothetical protein AB7D37_11145 [Desulfovibrio sp.]
MTYDQSAHITDLQARNTALVEENRLLKRQEATKGGPAVKLILAEYHQAIAKHPVFPADPSAIGSTLAEELLEVSTAGMLALQAINDHRDDGRNLTDVQREIAHVGAVCLRALGKLAGAKG